MPKQSSTQPKRKAQKSLQGRRPISIKDRKNPKKYLDDLFRECIMLKWGNRCLAEGDRNSKKCGGNVECSHIKPKSRGLVARYHTDNAIPLCHTHHLGVWHKDPIWAYQFIVELLGKPMIDKLEMISWQLSPNFDYAMEELYLKNYIKKHQNIDDKLADV